MKAPPLLSSRAHAVVAGGDHGHVVQIVNRDAGDREIEWPADAASSRPDRRDRSARCAAAPSGATGARVRPRAYAARNPAPSPCAAGNASSTASAITPAPPPTSRTSIAASRANGTAAIRRVDDRRPLALAPGIARNPAAHVVGRLPMMVMVIAMMVVVIVAVIMIVAMVVVIMIMAMMIVVMVMVVMVVTVVVRMVVRLVGHQLLRLLHSPPRHAAGQSSPALGSAPCVSAPTISEPVRTSRSERVSASSGSPSRASMPSRADRGRRAQQRSLRRRGQPQGTPPQGSARPRPSAA